MAVFCKDKCLYLKNTSKATSGHDLDRDNSNGGICKTCRTCGYYIITDVLRCICCGHKFALKNRKRRPFSPDMLLTKKEEEENCESVEDYTKKINGLIDLSYT